MLFDVPATGDYDVVLHYTVAPDYGNFTVLVAGRKAVDVVGYAPSVAPRQVSLGRHRLTAGGNQIVFTVFGKEAASSAYIVGLDWLALTKAVASSLTTAGRRLPVPALRPAPAPVAPIATSAGDQPVAETFATPRRGSSRIDACLHFKTDCGKPAADAFCDSKDHGPAVSFDIDYLVGEETWTLGDNVVCPPGKCNALRSVACSMLPKPLEPAQEDALEIHLSTGGFMSFRFVGPIYTVGGSDVSWDGHTQFHPGDFDGDGVDELARWGPVSGALTVVRFTADGAIREEKKVAQADGVLTISLPVISTATVPTTSSSTSTGRRRVRG